MNNNIINSLLKLQETDIEIIRLEKELLRIPGEIKIIDEKMQVYSLRLIEKKNNMDTLLKKRKEKEIDLASQNDKIKKLESQLYSLKSNKEYAAMLKEIKDIKENNSKFEEIILNFMFQYDIEKEEYSKLETEAKNFGSLISNEKDDKIKEEENLKKMLQEKLEARKLAVNDLDKNTIYSYERILKNKNDYAIVEIKGEICQGCHMGIPPQMINDIILSNELFKCPNCARIVYLNRTNAHS
ncbi:hypothetical protein HY745_14680 [Candidatus Desantisbacteria bacterium]|nr:hypothetical protein [Candidatus Desantisbacteria bacterium]